MTIDEAIKILNEMIEYGWVISDMDKCVAIDALEMAIKALEFMHEDWEEYEEYCKKRK